MISLALDNRNLAQTYDEVSNSQFDNGRRLLKELQLQPGATVLDIGCGTGRLGFHVLEQIGPTGRFIGIDPLPERIALANGKNRHQNAEFRTGIAEELGFLESASVDLVYLSAVFHWVTDKPRALAEIHRVLKPGGRVGLTTNSKELAKETTLRSVTSRVLGRESYRNLVNPDDFAPTRHGLTTTELLELLLVSGLSVTDFHIRPVRRSYQSGKDILAFAESSTFGNYLHHVPASLRDRARADLEAEFELLRDDDGIPFQGYTLSAVAEKRAERVS